LAGASPWGAGQFLEGAADGNIQRLADVAHPVGKVWRVFEAVSELPRTQQQKIIEVGEALVAQHANGG